MAGGTAGNRYIVRKSWRIIGGGKDLAVSQKFHLARIETYYLEMAAGTEAFQIFDRKALAAAADFAFVDITSSIEGVTFFFVDSATPTSSSPQVGPELALRPSEFFTHTIFSTGSRPAIRLSNDTDEAAYITIIYGAYS